jgi:hypothetical protein
VLGGAHQHGDDLALARLDQGDGRRDLLGEPGRLRRLGPTSAG